jgi:uncharacterized protein
MHSQAQSKHDPQKAADIVADAGGTVVGRTRLQKLAYLLELTGLGEGFQFQYRHYGPYSEGLAAATRDATLLRLVKEEEKPASWGGSFSVYTVDCRDDSGLTNTSRQELAKLAAKADPIELELAATAAFLSVDGVADAWGEVARRKPEKVEGGRLEKAKELYRKLALVPTPKPLPNIL